MIKCNLDGYASNLGPETSELDFKSLLQQEIHKKNWVIEWPRLSSLESTKPACQSDWLNVSNSPLQEWGSDHFCCTNNLPDLLCSTLESNEKVPPQKMSVNHMSSQGQVDHALKEGICFADLEINTISMAGRTKPGHTSDWKGYEASATTNKRLSLSHLELLHYLLWTKQSMRNSDPKTRTKYPRSISIWSSHQNLLWLIFPPTF